MNKKTVTIGIPAHNEEKNIGSLLESILVQAGDNFVVQKVIVVCDGCTDKTVAIATKLASKYKQIVVLNDGKQRGQAARLNQLYNQVKSDIFITFDADVQLGHTKVISELVKPFTDDKVGLVGGRVFALPQKPFIAKVLSVQEYFWGNVIDHINKGHNIHSHTGPISAARREFIQRIQRPASIVANDHFLYLSALQQKYRYVSAKKAFVYIKLPENFTDYMRQTTRFLDSAGQIQAYFGELAEKAYAIPYPIKLRAYWKAFKTYPFYLVCAIGLVILQRALGFFYVNKRSDGLWTAVVSSK